MTPPTSALQDAVAAAFERNGALALADEGHVEREVQVRMALAVALAIEDKSALVAEAGTGVGKTFAYLVPTLLSGARALISTATKSLQDQLFLRDLPRLREALKLPVSIALLKGRASYLCIHRMNQARQGAQLPDRWAVRTLAKVEQWSRITVSGDLAELDGLDERSSVIPLVTSTRENCLGSECPEFRACHVVKARREAMAADVVVVNHHLFFADMALRDTGVAELLPSVELAVFDEAHQLAEAGVQFLGTTLSSAQVIDFARDMLGAGLQLARGLVPWSDLAAGCDKAARDMRIAAAGSLRELRGTIKLRWDERAPREDFVNALAALGDACAAARAGLDMVSELSPEFTKLAERVAQLGKLAGTFAEPAAQGHVRWIDVSPHQARLVESPLDIRDALREQMAAGAQGLGVHLGHARRRRPAVVVHRIGWPRRRAGVAPGQPVRLRSPRAALRAAGVSKAQRAGSSGCGGHTRCTLRARARRAHLRADDHAARVAIDRRAAACRVRRAGRLDSGADAGQGAQAPVDAAIFGATRARCWSARRASGRASTCRATRCSAC